MKNITIGIPTYNRKKILTSMARSLNESDLSIANVHIRVYDDCSTEFDKTFLKEIFPNATSITVNEKNLKADLNTFSMYKDFLSSSDEYFFNADSDLIFRKDWLRFLLANIDNTDGIISIFNTKNHPVKKDNDDVLIEKETVGAAGTFFSRALVEKIVTNLNAEQQNHVDWSFCKYFTECGVRIFCSKDSYVQHIGFVGQNTRDYGTFDFGKNFLIDSELNGQILNNVMEEFLEKISSKFENAFAKAIRELYSSRRYKVGTVVLSPLILIKKILKRINIQKEI